MANSGLTVALVGSESLMGREVRDIVANGEGGIHLRLIAADHEEPGTLTRVGDEPVALTGLNEAALDGAHVVVLAGSTDSSQQTLDLVQDGTAIIDLMGVAENRPESRLRAPMVEGEVEADDERVGNIHVVAHPAAIALALFLRRLHAHDPIRRSVIQILAPASEHGAHAVEELQQQTANLFSFKTLPKEIFDAQLSFNLLAQYGEEAPVPLEETALRIERHLATLLALEGDGEGAPMPSLRLVQAPVFHGYSFSAWVEFEESPDVEQLESSLVTAHIEVRGGDFEPPNNVGHAGMGGISVGGIAPDRNHADAFWFWVVADNIRLLAENGVAVARAL